MRQDDPDYDAWDEAINEELNMKSDRCQCRLEAQGIGGICPGPRNCPLVDHDEDPPDQFEEDE